MATISSNPQIERINSLGQFFSDPIQLNSLHQNNNLSSTVQADIQQEKENEIPTKPIQNDTKPSNTKTNQSGPSKSKHFWRNRIEIDPTCQVFFALVKPKGAQQGSRVIFMYAPPLYAIFDQTKEELEMIPTTTKFYLEGRFLILVNNGRERAFSIKVDEKRFYDLLSNKSKDKLLQFCYFCQLNRYLLPPVFLTNPFYNNVVNQDRFYVMLSHFPVDAFNREYMDNYVRAVDPMMDTVLEQLVRDFLDPLEVDISKAPKNKFVFKFLHTVLRVDDTFGNLKTGIEKSRKPQEALILGIESQQFNDRTKMALHILYSETAKHFPGMDTAGKLTASVIISSVVDYLLEKNLPSKVEAIQSIDGFNRGILSTTMYRRYVKSIDLFAQQPQFYQLTKKGTFSFESFVVLLHFVWSNINKFVFILEKHSNPN